MPEERGEDDVRVAVLRLPLVPAGPLLPPELVCDRVRWGTISENVHDHRFVVAGPLSVPGKPRPRVPSHQDPRVEISEPLPVCAAVNRVGERADLHFSGVAPVEIFPRIENPGEKQPAVDRRELAVPGPDARVHVEKMIEKPFVPRCAGWGGCLGGSPE